MPKSNKLLFDTRCTLMQLVDKLNDYHLKRGYHNHDEMLNEAITKLMEAQSYLQKYAMADALAMTKKMRGK